MNNVENKIYIVCKRWFQKSYGNTYHSVRIEFNEPTKEDYSNATIVIPFEYGYGEQCLQTAYEALVKHGHIEKTGKPYWQVFKENKIAYSIQDVDRKKDL